MRKLCRFLFSRYTLSLIAISLDVSLLTLIILRYISSYFWFAVITAVFGTLVVLSLINRETNPEFKVTWLVIIFVMPIFGAVLYVLFYSWRLSAKDSGRLGDIFKKLRSAAADDEDGCAALSHLSELDRSAAGRAMSVMADDYLAKVYENTSIRYYPLGEDMYTDMLSAIDNANRYIFLEYFIIDEGEMWQGIYTRLLKKKAEGVEVRLMYDDIGSMSTLPRSLRRGGRLSALAFGRVSPKISSVHNNRDHRKLLIVDGTVAFTGGINIADEYINKKERFGHWKDSGVKITGDAVLGFVRLFLSLYDFTAKTCSDYSEYLEASSIVENSAESDCHALKVSESDVESSTDCENEPLGNTVFKHEEALEAVAPGHEKNTADNIRPDGANLFDEPIDSCSGGAVAGLTEAEETATQSEGFYIPFGSGPAPIYPAQTGKNAYINIINRAEKYLYITTPYLIIDYELTEALRMAAKRGVDVRIITPGKADKAIVKIVTKSSYARLLSAGVRIYEYTPGFIHEKLIISDDVSAIIGTINLDYRSLVHHFEDGLWIYSSPEIITMRDCFMDTVSKSCEQDGTLAKLKLHEAVIRYIVRIFAPLL